MLKKIGVTLLIVRVFAAGIQYIVGYTINKEIHQLMIGVTFCLVGVRLEVGFDKITGSK